MYRHPAFSQATNWVARFALFGARTGFFLFSSIWVVGLLWFAHGSPADADTLPSFRAPGRGTLVYSNGTTTPQQRGWAGFNTTNLSAASATLASRNPFQVAVKNSPARDNERVMAVADSAGNLEVLRSVDGGTSWTSGFTTTIGGTGTTRRFDVAFEQNSGEAVVAYSKNATTNEIGIRRFTTSWQSETTYDPSLTAAVVSWIELAERRGSDELALGYLTTNTTNNINAAIWSGGSNTFGNEPAANIGICDQTAGPNGIDKCYDVDYETASGLPVVNWGVSSAGDTTSTIRSTRWNGSTWTTTTISLGALTDDATSVDCESNPESTSIEILCGSWGASTLDTQGWTVVGGALGSAGINKDTGAHAVSAGKQFIGTAYLVSNGNRKGVIFYADATGATANLLNYFTFDGTTWSAALTMSKTMGAEDNVAGVTNPYDDSEAMFTFSTSTSTLFAVRASLSGTTLTLSNADSNASLGTVSNIVGRAYDFTFDPLGAPSKLTQDGYIFENDDEDQATGDAVDENTQQAAGNTAITSVKKGERVTVRAQIKNTGGKVGANLGLFYDRNDGIFSQVSSDKPAVTATGSCTNSAYDCSTPDTISTGAGDGSHTDMAFDQSGNPWISYWDQTNTAVKVAQFVGTGGNCTNGAWRCSIVDTIGTNASDGQYTSIAFDTRNRPWISYFDGTNTAVKVATKGGGFGSACTDTSWTCAIVDTMGTNANDGKFTSIAPSPTGAIWVSYHSGTDTGVKTATFVGAGGTNCAVTTWTCTLVDTIGANASDGQYTSIAFDQTGAPWLSYFDGGNTAVKVANYVGVGGGCTSNAWNCTTVDTLAANTDDGKYTSIAFSPNGNAWVSYFDSGSTAVKVATKGGGFGSACTDGTWTCAIVDTLGTNGTDGQYSSIAFDAAGQPWVSYSSGTDTGVKTANYVGSGGGCTSGSWNCAVTDTLGSNASDGQYGSLAFNPSGEAYLSYFDATNTAVKVANIKRGGELLVTSGIAGSSGDALNESHADMSSATDTTERDTADCISGSTTWNSGKWSEQTESNPSIPAGISTAQCTELAFVIDTSNAVAGRTYRLLLSSKDNWRSDIGAWRGPIGVSSGAYATLTIEADTTLRASKDTQAKFTNCSNTAWGCMDVDASANGAGFYSSIAMDAAGAPWISYYEETSLDLKVAKFVGTGGSGCGGSPVQWTCTTVDSTGDQGNYSSIAFDPNGIPWVAYIDRTADAIKVAKFVGSGGTGCATTAWTCITVDDTGGTDTEFAHIAFDRAGAIWLAYFDFNTDLKAAQFVGSGGTGCSSTTAWSCVTVEQPANTVGNNSSMALDNSGNPWISYFDSTSGDMRVARRKPGTSAASGCTADWECTLVKGTNGYATLNTSITFDQNGAAYVAFDDVTTGNSLMVAKYVGASGSNCTSAAWTCTIVDSGNSGLFQAAATAPDGTVWIAHYSSPTANLNMARQKPGNAASGTCAVDWECFIVNDTAQDIGNYPSMAFDSSGSPWISAINDSDSRLTISKPHLPVSKPTAEPKNFFRARNATHGDARYRLDAGKSPRTESGTCSATTDNKGYCGIAADDSDFDNMASLANERPMYVFDNKSASNSTLPTVTWKGRSNIAPSGASTTGDLVLQVYKFGTTNAWTNVITDAASSNCNTADCTLTATLTGTASDYYELIDGSYWSYYRVWQYENSSTETLKTDVFTVSGGNTTPTNPGTLQQKKTTDAVLSTGDWTNETSVKFTASISDPDVSDTLQLCVEKKALGVGFSNSEDLCGTGVAYSGTPVTASVTIPSIADGEYHWQARVKDAGGLYSGWVSYDVNLESARDFGLDSTAPSGGTVYDGTSVGSDASFNDGSLSQLSANWSGFSATVAGLARYEYSIGTSAGATDTTGGWINNNTSTSVTASGLTLQTSKMYFFNVRAVDNAGNTQSPAISSNGQLVAPSLSFGISPTSITFNNLNATNSYTDDTKTTTLTTSTNAYGGYVVRLAATSLLSGATTIPNFTGGSYASPDSWQGGDTGFGYTSSDNDVQGINKFQASTCPGGSTLIVPGCYASYSTTKPGDIVADHTGNVTGNPIINQQFTISHRITASATQAATTYATVLMYTVAPIY